MMLQVFKPALPFVGLCLAASAVLPAWADIWLSTATFFTVMSQQFHAWSHMKRSELHPAVVAAQVRHQLLHYSLISVPDQERRQVREAFP